jgi:short-subunit dehydrogenase
MSGKPAVLITGASTGIAAVDADRFAPSWTQPRDVNALPAAMESGELVDAALIGFDRRETVTIPPLPDANQGSAFETARQAMLPNFMQTHPAERYRTAA